MLALVGVFLGGIAFFVTPSSTVSTKWIIAISIVLVIGLWTLLDAFVHVWGSTTQLPGVRASCAPPPLYDASVALLLIEPSTLYGTNALVSVYVRENDFERIVGVGFVSTIQDNGLVQVIVSKSVIDDSDPLWQRIRSNDAAELKRLMVKPSVPNTPNLFEDS